MSLQDTFTADDQSASYNDILIAVAYGFRQAT
jgi:hypothetical protein